MSTFTAFSVTPGNASLTANWTWSGSQTRFMVFIDAWPISATLTPTDYGSSGPNSQLMTTLPPHFGGGPLVNGVTYRVEIQVFETSDRLSFIAASDPIFIAPVAPSGGPYIYIRPVVTTTTIRYNWEISTLGATNFILTCESTDGGGGGGTVTLNSTISEYTFTGLTFGKTYGAGLNATVGGSPTPSSIYRTVTTGNPPGIVQNVAYTSTLTTINFSWEAPAGVQTPPVGWYVINDSNASHDYNTRFYTSNITIPFDQTPNRYSFYSVSDTGYSSTVQVVIESAPIVPLAGSLFFNNDTNAYLNLSGGVTIGAGAYTIETWFYNNADWDSQRALLGGFTFSIGAMSLFFTVPGSNISLSTDKYGGAGQRSYSFPTPSLNAWHHIALTRNASLFETVFIDGVRCIESVGGLSNSGGLQYNDLDYNGASMDVAKFYGGFWPGYLTNMRINVGSNVYDPNAATITVPNTGPLAVISPYTQYLMLGATVTGDASGIQTVTNNSDLVTQSSVKPF